MKFDDEPPQILKVSLEQGSLNLLTSEIATCSYYGNSSVLFENMTLFSNTGNLIHSTSFGNVNYIHVKCKDRFDRITSVDVYKG